MAFRNFTPFPSLSTERLTLRRLSDRDDNDIFSLRSNKELNKYLGRKPAKSIADASSFIETVTQNIQLNESIYWAIVIKDIDRLIGTICLYEFSDDCLRAEIGYELLPEFQGQGIMREAMSEVIDFAFKRLGLTSIVACSHINNQSSARILQYFGFERQGSVGNDLLTFKLGADARKIKQQNK